ncbi:hypothetical protein F5Y17DRAFT_240231 [Xylariaceae sp. FL0594]|nr:hypothetical protein F5Y17DRAFT_240231 [Xylariaceae sp. FL0594]
MEVKPAADSKPSGDTFRPLGISAESTGSTREAHGGGVIESPVSPSSTNVLARFEFETGRGNEGSKILMVEWDYSCDGDGPEPSTEDRDGWEVSWEGKPATYAQYDEEASSPTLRVYFLLPENAAIPPSVTISHPPTGRTLVTKCLPAIFAPGLGASQPDSGRRGVLHTIWAKKRLAQLQREIDEELKTNSEGVALEMALQERLWLIDHFGLVDLDAQRYNDASAAVAATRPAPPPTPQSPRSPIGGRLGEMLKGLRLSTSPSDLANTPATTPHRLVPQSFPPDLSSTNNASSTPAPVPKLSVPRPDPGVASLDALITGASSSSAVAAPNKETEDELFALPMSPRSPEMKTSPFSFLR